MSRSAERVLEELLRVSGVRRWRVGPREPTARRLEVAQRSRARGRELIGELTCEDGVFVFRYVPSYDGPPIPEFSRKDLPYRSDVLWTFFAVRIPPTGRPDVQEVMKGIDADDPLEMLAALGDVSVTNPYELRLVGEGAGGG